jgi:ribokinase
VNAVEAAQLAAHLGTATVPVPELLVTLGAGGARLQAGGAVTEAPAFAVEAVDTTGAGDCFLGWFLAWRDAGAEPPAALRQAMAAAALQVTRPGAGEAIPTAAEVEAFLEAQNA